MILDTPTISLVSLSATTIIGLLLCFTWWRERSSTLIGWWGVSQLVMAAGIAFASASAFTNDASLTVFGQAIIVLSAAVMWMAVREFQGRTLNPLWVAIWPCGFIIAAATGVLSTFDQRIIIASTTLGILHLLAAAEFARHGGEPLLSRWPAIVLLTLTGICYLAWIPLTLAMPIRAIGLLYTSVWVPTVILFALLGRIALAFVVLALDKERREAQQRTFALTDALTGLPNRRALFEAADALAEAGQQLAVQPVSVLVFDLDHFKRINDTYGHRLGDSVLQLFSDVLSDELDQDGIIGRLGGEEFAAILPGADLRHAADQAEKVRVAFAAAAGVIDGFPVAATVSVGAASAIDCGCDIGGLFHRADGALYTAKQNGRNRVHAYDGEVANAVPEGYMLPPHWLSDALAVKPQARATRRYRGSADAA